MITKPQLNKQEVMTILAFKEPVLAVLVLLLLDKYDITDFGCFCEEDVRKLLRLSEYDFMLAQIRIEELKGSGLIRKGFWSYEK